LTTVVGDEEDHWSRSNEIAEVRGSAVMENVVHERNNFEDDPKFHC